jgi:hypothetical protein
MWNWKPRKQKTKAAGLGCNTGFWDPRSGVANGLKTNLCLKFSVLELIDFHRPKMRTSKKEPTGFSPGRSIFTGKAA